MIRYIQHSQIDTIRWDDCIEKAINRRVYAFSWYLNTICPGWDALVEDDYLRVFPLTHNRKWGISYLYQPFFMQQLGIFSPLPVESSDIKKFFDSIPGRFQFIEIQLNSMNDPGLLPGNCYHRKNHELDLSPGYERLFGSYSQNTRRNLKKSAGHNLVLREDASVAELVGLFKSTFGKKEGKLKEVHYASLEVLLSDCLDRRRGNVRSVHSAGGKLMAAAFLMHDGRRIYFLFAASSAEARENGAMFFLIDQIILKFSESGMILDFEGGEDHDLGRFYKSFGADEVTYPAIRINRLNPVLKWVFNLAGRARM